MKKLQEKADPLKLGLYVHVPFCARSCDFCHFYQEAPTRGELESYLAGMEKAFSRARLSGKVETVFWGGGTPGLLASKDLERLGLAQQRALGGQRPSEWTVEMAPATIKKEKLRVLRDLGVNRLSIGVQSFQPDLLEALGRVHSLAQVHRAIELLHATDFENFNLDLIFAIPGQDLAAWESDLESAIRAHPAHISTYCLTFEEDTALWLRLRKGQIEKTDPEAESAFFDKALDVLAARGFEQYEVSNHARPGFTCRHNIHTWQMQEWLGLGPSAASQLGGMRWTEPPSLVKWLDGLEEQNTNRADVTILTPAMLAQDYLIFGLRMTRGVDLDLLETRFSGSLPASWDALKASLIDEGLAGQSQNRLFLTRRGLLVADRIGQEILELS